MHSRSCSVKLISSVVKKPLLRMLRWLRVAPFGLPVVPDVYWMLIGSSASSDHVTSSARVTPGSDTLWSVHSGEPRKSTCSSPTSSRTSATIAR